MSESKMQLQGRLSENVIYPKRFPLLPSADKDITGPALPLIFDVLWYSCVVERYYKLQTT